MTISRTALREQVKDVLLQRIAGGELPPGGRIVETRVAQELGTSQGPVREALRELEQLGLVESEPYRGSRVRTFDSASLAELVPVRAVLEGLAARLAAVRLDGDVSLLEAEVDAMRAADAAGGLAILTTHEIAFHRRLVEAAGNAVLERQWRALGVEGWIALTVYEVHVDPGEAADAHLPIVEAIRDRDPARAARAASDHILRNAPASRRGGTPA